MSTPKPQKAVVLLNMGGISCYDEIEIFLTNMFHDENILTIKSRWVRSFVAKMIVRGRKKRASENYAVIKNASPILPFTQKLVKKLNRKAPNRFFNIAMRYTPPFATQAIQELKERGIEDIFLLPMYPQYSTTTTKSSLDEIVALLQDEIPNAKVTFVKRFYQNPKVVDLIVDIITKKIPRGEDLREYCLIFSAHSLPQSIIDKGDSYERELHHQIELIKAEMLKRGLITKKTLLAYQSKLGPVKWLGPPLEHVITNMPNWKITGKDGLEKPGKKVLVYPLSFTIDNAETCFELAIETKELAKSHDYEAFWVCRAFNSCDAFVDIIEEITR